MSNETREQTARWLCERRNGGGGWDHEPGRRLWLEDADALLSGPLAPLLAAQEAVKRVEAVAEFLTNEANALVRAARNQDHDPLFQKYLTGRANAKQGAAARIRAALASPAPAAGAPWGHDEVPELHGRSEPVPDGPGAGAPAAGPADGAVPTVQGSRDCTCPVGPVVPPWGHWRSCPTYEPRR